MNMLRVDFIIAVGLLFASCKQAADSSAASSPAAPSPAAATQSTGTPGVNSGLGQAPGTAGTPQSAAVGAIPQAWIGTWRTAACSLITGTQTYVLMQLSIAANGSYNNIAREFTDPGCTQLLNTTTLVSTMVAGAASTAVPSATEVSHTNLQYAYLSNSQADAIETNRFFAASAQKSPPCAGINVVVGTNIDITNCAKGLWGGKVDSLIAVTGNTLYQGDCSGNACISPARATSLDTTKPFTRVQ